MHQNHILIIILSLLPLFVSAQDIETAQDAVKNMKVGWNLGNSLDNNSGDTLNMWIEWNPKPISPDKYETSWGQPVTTRQLIHMLKLAGFNAIRVPVTWYPHMEMETGMAMGSDGYTHPCWYRSQWQGMTVDSIWMARVREVVDYVINEGMYCVINVHHDTGAHNAAWIVADEAIYNKEKSRFENLWTQIATEFRDYDQHLLFEGYNEMVDPYYSWCFASFGTSKNYDTTVATSAYNAINNYAQSFVDAVRATGGNNSERNLICNTYAACCGDGTWSSHLTDPLTKMKKPSDSASDHLIFEVHCYPTVTSLSTTKSSVSTVISRLKTNLQTKAPVIFGEWGYADGTDTVQYRQNTLSFAKYFVQQAKAANMGTFYWMGITDGQDRSVPQWTNKDLAEAILKGYYGDDYTIPAKGDVNVDGSVNISDVNAIISVICGSTLSDDIDKARADVNADGSVNISDVNAVIAIICGN